MVTPGKLNNKHLLLSAQAIQDEGVQAVAIQGASGLKLAHVNSPHPLHLHRQHGPDCKLHLGMLITFARNSKSPLMLHNTPKYPLARAFPAFRAASEPLGNLSKNQIAQIQETHKKTQTL
jgi:hypothetical protein